MSERTTSAPARRPDRILGGRYRLVERIDEGGAGEVWRAHDEKLDREVAVKLLGTAADEAFRERFTSEARRAAAVAHPNVVTVFDEGREGRDAYMVMEYVRGRTLRDVIADRGPLPPHEVSRIVAQIAAALDAAHGSGLVHCDVKPANVILDASGTAKLTDFGVARAARDPAEHELIATPRYIAPERIEGKPATPESDVYGLGLVAYELLAGRPAFEGVETEDLLRMRLEDGVPSLRGVRLGVPDAVDEVIRKALARQPSRRYGSAGEFARALATASERGEQTQPLGVPVPRPLRRSAVGLPPVDSTLAVLAVILVLLAVIALFARFPDIAPQAPATPTATAPAATVGVTPNVLGKELKDAVRDLQRAGFAGVRWDLARDTQGKPCSVARQEPSAGTAIARGATAAVFYVSGKDCTKGINDD